MFHQSLSTKRGNRAFIEQGCLRSLFAGVAVLALAACGGGGGAGGSTPPLGATNGAVVPQASATASSVPATPLPNATPVSLMNVPLHVPTWVYDHYSGNGAVASASQVQKFVTYAESGLGNSKAQADCNTTPKSCYSVYYFDPNFQYAGAVCPMQPDAQFLAASSESWFVHESGYNDTLHRVQGTYNEWCKGVSTPIPVYLTNQNDPGVVAWFQSYLQKNGDNWDYYFMDDTSTNLIDQTYGPGGGFCQDLLPNKWCTSTQEYANDAAVLQAHSSFASQLNHVNGSPMQFFFNGVGFGGQTPRNVPLVSAGNGHFSGIICEGCVVSAGSLRPTMYAGTLNAMAQVNAVPNGSIVLLSTGSSPAGSAAQITQRTLATAIAWLGYADGHTIVFPDLEYNTQNLSVWPENLIYTGAPLQTMYAGAADLSVASGVYRREFSSCFNARTAIGACAAIVNATNATVTVSSAWLQQSYGHVIGLSGGDVLAGGSVSFASSVFTPNATTIAPGQALLLSQ